VKGIAPPAGTRQDVTKTDESAATTAELLAQAAWARRLARRLVADEARADDLVQQAWLAALQRRSDAIRASARGWFGGVLRNVAAKTRRESARRDARERAAATAEALPPTADHVAGFEAQRLIVDALLAIDEPYRETLVRRWYRDEKPAAIARAMAIPVKTVDTRLARGPRTVARGVDGPARRFEPGVVRVARAARDRAS
jgi:RNA polymerase sigma factor (sigma-70 family)